MFRGVLREHGVYHCADRAHVGLSLSPDEAEALRAEAEARRMRLRLHPRTFLLESRRRIAVVLDWHMPYASCPFLVDFKCTAYEKRPLVCRAYPVMAPAPAWALAPECPKAEPTLAARQSGAIRFGSFLRIESAARRAIDRAHAALDVEVMEVLDTPGARFAKGLEAREAAERLRRYRALSPAQFRGLGVR